MTGAEAVLVCVLELLGRSPKHLPPIELVASRPPDVSVNAEAWVRDGTGVISLLTSTTAFREANCDNPRSLFKLASIVAHEEYHVRHGSGERGAYETQLGTLLRLGVPPDSSMYAGVVRSMSAVLQAQKRALEAVKRVKPEGVLAAAETVP